MKEKSKTLAKCIEIGIKTCQIIIIMMRYLVEDIYMHEESGIIHLVRPRAKHQLDVVSIPEKKDFRQYYFHNCT